jgi:hypothetical protein
MATLNSTSDEVRALLELVKRAPMTRAEVLFAEALFARWLEAIEAEAPGGDTTPLDPPAE